MHALRVYMSCVQRLRRMDVVRGKRHSDHRPEL